MAVRHWFITPASGGLGRHLTEHALQHGDRVTATVRRPVALQDLRETYGDRLTVEILDVTRRPIATRRSAGLSGPGRWTSWSTTPDTRSWAPQRR
ncbi:hypothetical protein [Streptomyces lydicus]|uniref:hypothetical protein n=1 Tax=Streptomyces lydicus TaxID=47763 RepID=UPI0019D6CF0E|nr:hypothetical protein [Streptomyces lydicus]MCZ1011763.1 hypothetical protein [Streptomyces lydicus]